VDVNSIYDAKAWTADKKTSKKPKKSGSFIDSLITATQNKKSESTRLTTKITTTINGDTVMLFIRGDKVVKAVKLGAFNDILKMPILDSEIDVGDGSLNVASLFNDSNTTDQEEITTKIITNEQGEKIMLLMQGEKILKKIKIGGNENLFGDTANKDNQQSVDNKTLDVNSFLNNNI